MAVYVSTSIPTMDWSSTDMAESIGLFKQKMNLFLDDENVTDNAAKARKICRGIGDEGLRRINASDLSPEQKQNPLELWTLFENQLKVNVNFRIHRLHLMKYRQTGDESIDDFVTRARTLANKCQFTENELNERLMELIIASTPYDGLRRELLGKPIGHTIRDVLKEGRKFEALSAGNDQLQRLDTKQSDIHTVSYVRKCGNCGTSHKPRQCPAYKDKCSACNAIGHWKACCRKTRTQQRPSSSGKRDDRTPSNRHGNPRRRRTPSSHRKNSKVHSVDTDYETDGESYQQSFYAITVSTQCLDAIDNRSATRDEAFVVLDVQPPGLKGTGYTLRLKIDSGASGNTLPMRTFRQMYGNKADTRNLLEPANGIKLTAYNGEEIRCMGTLDMKCQHKSSGWKTTRFYVVDVPGPAVVGLPTSEILNLVTINVDGVATKPNEQIAMHAKKPHPRPILKKTGNMQKPTHINSIEDLKQEYPEQFDKLGNFPGEAKLHVKDDAEPFIDAPRKCPIHIKDELKHEIDNLVTQGVIRKVDEHTDWCSSLAFSTKKDGSMRICLDPQRLNNSLKRCPHKIPTVEELNPQFAKAKVFSKLDAKAGYWAIHLEKKSQLLTTFRTPFGRYCWLRLPFGLNVSQDIFQSRMDQHLDGLTGVVSIADDIVVFGESEEDHDRNLTNLMKQAERKGLVFNSKKCHIKQSCVSFFGNRYTPDGIKPDPDKVRDIRNMPSPQSKEDVQRFLGLLTYLSPFIPQLADKTHVLRSLVKEDVPWTWDTDQQTSFETLKKLIYEDACLQYYDRRAPVELEVDASQKGLGAALVQNGKPVAFGSKTLTECQSRYSNIEREMLAVVSGIQRYHTYLYARPFTVISDQKPLETICAKPIHAAPPRLQRMLLQIQGYNFKVKYRPGKTMVLADTLSRLPNPENNAEIELDVRVDGIDLVIDDPECKTIALINFPPHKRQLLRDETTQDPLLNELQSIVHTGWPDTIKELPTDIRPYWSFRDELAMESGVLFKGRQILIPQSMQKEILQQLHQGHQGVEKTRRLARDTVYWVNINRDIEVICKSCHACQENQVINTKEPLMPHTPPTRPWQYIASDLFEINGKQYLLTVDRYSKYPLVDYMPNPVSSHAVTEKMKTYCAMFGRPDEIMTDGGPQYSGKQFKEFTKNWGICHTMSSPHYPRSNGFIERHVRHVKPIIRKTIRNGEDIQLTLLNLRATPIDTGLPSPAEMIFGRPIPTMLPQRGMPAPIEQRERFAQQQANMKTHHDQTSRHVDLPPLYKGQKVRILDKTSKTWCPGTVLEKCQEPRSYLVETPNGTRVRRNRSHLRDMTIQTRSVSFADEEVNDHPNSHAEHSPPHSTDNETRLMQNESTPNAGERRIPCTDNQTVDGDVRRKSCRAIRRPQRYDS